MPMLNTLSSLVEVEIKSSRIHSFSSLCIFSITRALCIMNIAQQPLELNEDAQVHTALVC
jgi:hypothetical protein